MQWALKKNISWKLGSPFTGRSIKNSGISNKFHAAANERRDLPQLPVRRAMPLENPGSERGGPVSATLDRGV